MISFFFDWHFVPICFTLWKKKCFSPSHQLRLTASPFRWVAILLTTPHPSRSTTALKNSYRTWTSFVVGPFICWWGALRSVIVFCSRPRFLLHVHSRSALFRNELARLTFHAHRNLPCYRRISASAPADSICYTCKGKQDRHLLVKCDTCKNVYHLGCLDPPLAKMPRKTKTHGW